MSVKQLTSNFSQQRFQLREQTDKRTMRIKLTALLIGLALLGDVYEATAQGSHFFLISGPATTTIIAFNSDGTLVWSNALTGTNYIVQTATSLAGGGNWVDYVQLPVSNSVNTNLIASFNPPAGMALIPAGSFTMGNTLNVDIAAIPTNVYVSAFYMDVCLVSYTQWQTVYNWATNTGYSFFDAGTGKATNHPVQTVDWYDCVEWCNARSQQAGLNPVYYTDARLTKVFKNWLNVGYLSLTPVYANWTNNGYRLPTEAEWEKGARGGLIGQRYPWGDTISESQANYDGNTNVDSTDLGPNGYNTNYDNGAQPFTSPVGTFAPNGYGLYDMAGNVEEWCWDFEGTYGQPTTTNPTGPASGAGHVLRGSGWNDSASDSQCASRTAFAVPYFNGTQNNTILESFGFRCVRGL
jgi:formylglycine-generating enzyme required for sulfatase activity